MNQDKTFLGTQPIGRLLLKLAIPTVIAQLVNMLYNIVDRVYIGHMPGESQLALTGVGVCMPLIIVVSAFAAFVSSGGAPRASIFMGKGDLDRAEKTLGGCFTMQIGISVVLTAALLLWGRPLLLVFGASENTIQYAVDYLNVYAIGTIFVQLTLGLNAFITAQGFATMSMITVLIGAAVNIVLDPIFIFVLNLGVRGAALATVISQGISCVWVVRFLNGKKTTLRLKRKNFFPGGKWVWPCVALGLAAFTMQASESVISVCFNSSLLKYGGDVAVGAMTILSSVMQFAMMPVQGIAQGAQPITSYNYGAGNSERVRKVFRLLLAVSLGYTVLLWGVIELFPAAFARIFTPQPGAGGLYRPGAAGLLRGAVPVRHPDRLPDDLCVHRERGVLHYRGGAAEVCPAGAPDLPDALSYGGQDHGGVYGGACHRRPGRDLYRGSLCRPVPEGPEKAGGEGESLKFL